MRAAQRRHIFARHTSGTRPVRRPPAAGPRARRPPRRPRPRLPRLAKMGQHDGQVVDVHRAVAGEVAVAQVWPVWPKWLSTMVRSLMSTLPSPLASPGEAAAFQHNGGHVHAHLVGVGNRVKPEIDFELRRLRDIDARCAGLAGGQRLGVAAVGAFPRALQRGVGPELEIEQSLLERFVASWSR